MSLSNHYRLDPKKLADGIEVKRDANEDGSIPTFYLRFTGSLNKEYSKALEVATRPHMTAINAKRMNRDLADQLFLDVFVKTILVGWENVLMSDVSGNSEDQGFAPFTIPNATMLFKNLPLLYDELQEESKNADNYKKEEIEVAAKN